MTDTAPPAIPLCAGRWELFDSCDTLDHDQAAKLCRACPALAWCEIRSHQLNVSGKTGSYRPLTGTWAGRMYGAAPGDDSRYAREESMFTDDDAKEAHAAWGRGVRNDRTRVGERVYQRRAGRRKRARRELKAAAAA